MNFFELVTNMARYSTMLLELLGMAVIVVMSLYAISEAVALTIRKGTHEDILSTVRPKLIRGILLGLEFLVAADIIKTVALELTLTSVAFLSIIVLIRTFLSFALELEINGRWPWQECRSGKE